VYILSDLSVYANNYSSASGVIIQLQVAIIAVHKVCRFWEFGKIRCKFCFNKKFSQLTHLSVYCVSHASTR